jgi:UDPglucose--hexose-1-phosphate uridylyltransferase
MFPADFDRDGAMDSLRYDRLHDTWVIVAPDRSRRPSDLRLQTVSNTGMTCPFCPGNEHETPPEILATGREPPAAADQPPWRVRVFPNRFPALTGPDGRHEVVVITPDHDRDLARCSPAEVAEILTAIQTRVRALQRDAEIAAVSFFLNAGAGAGASLSHPHGQLLATRVVPAVLRTELAAFAAWRQEHDACLICAASAAAADEQRLIAADADALLYAPWAGRFAWEMHVLPRRHQGDFGAASEAELAAVGGLLRAACRALQAVVPQPAYNLVLHTAPAAVQDFHWHLELLPRLAPLAGFETGTGFFINPVAPEDAAAELRRAVHQAQREDPR